MLGATVYYMKNGLVDNGFSQKVKEKKETVIINYVILQENKAAS